MKIYDELLSDHVAVNLIDEDRVLIGILNNVPYFVRRFFIVELEAPEEAAFLEFYTRAGFGEMAEDHVVRISLKSKDSIQRVAICSFIMDGTSICEELLEFLLEYRSFDFTSIEKEHRIEYDSTVYGSTAENSAIKLITHDFLINHNFLELGEDALKTREEVRIEDESRKRAELEQYLGNRKSVYENIDVDFLSE